MKDYSILDGMIANQRTVLQTAFDKGFKQGYEEGREKNLTQLRDEQYKNGFEAGQIIGKDIGRAEVWEAIKTYYKYWKNCCGNAGRFASELKLDAKLGQDVFDVLFKMSPVEAIRLLKKYENKQKCKECLHEGDTIVCSRCVDNKNFLEL